MNIDIICPLYNAENYIVDLQKSIELQSKYGNINNIRYIITKGKDKEQLEEMYKAMQEKSKQKTQDDTQEKQVKNDLSTV